jgi:hypothetical protein
MLGPFVILTALAVLGTGLALVALGNDAAHNSFATIAGFQLDAITLHQASFIAWLAVVGIHALTRTVGAVRIATSAGPAARGVPGAPTRLTILATTLLVGGVAAAIVLQLSTAWTHR